MGIDLEPEPGLADNGDFEHDLQASIEAAGEAARAAGTALAIFIDELQYVEEDQLAALVTALHRAAQRRLTIVLVGAELPQLRGRMGRAKSYAERLFDFPEIGSRSRPTVRRHVAWNMGPAGNQRTEHRTKLPAHVSSREDGVVSGVRVTTLSG